MKSRTLLLLPLLLVAGCGSSSKHKTTTATGVNPKPPSTTYRKIATIAPPGPFKGAEAYDIGWVDPASETYYLTDRTNATVDVVDAKTDRLVKTIPGFIGTHPPNDATSGPDGILEIPSRSELWVADAQSKVLVVDLAQSKIVASISTHGKGYNRVDEMGYDPKEQVLLVANDNDTPPFLTFISVPGRKVVGKIPMPQATGGIEQPAYNPADGKFYQSIPMTTANKTGEVDQIDPVTMKVTKVFPIRGCQPTGLSLGPNNHFMVGCQQVKPAVIGAILDVTTGSVTRITQAGGGDEVWFNPGDHRWYYPGVDAKSGNPVLAVVDGATGQWVVNVPLSGESHSVAVDPTNGHVFVPDTQAGIEVYAPA
jgi:DNA-binding beta-propeller fold protein YncE